VQDLAISTSVCAYAAVCCSVLQRGGARCTSERSRDWSVCLCIRYSLLQCAGCSVLLCVALCFSVLQCGSVCCPCERSRNWVFYLCIRCSVLQCAAVCCSVLQCAAEWCSVVQCVALVKDTAIGLSVYAITIDGAYLCMLSRILRAWATMIYGYLHTYIHVCKKCIRTNMYAYMRTRIHRYTQTYVHTHGHI